MCGSDVRTRWPAILLGVAALLLFSAASCQKASSPPVNKENERAEGRVEHEKELETTANTAPTTADVEGSSGDSGAGEPFPSFGNEQPYAVEKLRTQYTKEVAGEGPLYASVETSAGSIRCRLYEDKAPRTVDNFVGLALGLKPWRDPKTHAIVKRPFYEGLAFHRVIPGLLIQSGDPTGTGMGGPGFVFDDERAEGLSHSQPGVLSMAQSAPNQNGSQFFITDGPAPQFDERYAIFGLCSDIETVHTIANAEANPRTHRPLEPITITSITFSRESP